MKARDSQTGTLKDVYVKAVDSMPIGTQIEYSGTDIPIGWEEVNDYSTTEIKTGKKWIDGKDIYRKVFTYSNVAIANNTSLEAIITSDPTKIDIVKMEGVFKHATGTNRETRPFPTIASDGKPLQIRWSNNYIKFSGTDTWSSGSDRDIYVIIEYTKTTD